MFKIITPEMKINRSHYLMDNLVAYYDFSAGIGGKLVDKSGNEFHGELFNMNPSSSWNTGYDGHCLQFTLSPVGQMVKSHEAKNAAAFVGYAPGTVIALAYRMNNWATSQFRGIVSKRENSPSYDWSFRCNENYLSALTSGPVSVNASISTPYRQWFVGAAVFAPNSTTIYQNGIIVGNGSRGNVSNTNTPIIIGNGIHTNATDATGFDGYIGKIIIFNRALINEEIKEISERILSQRTYDFYEKPSASIFVYGTACPKSKIEIPSYSLKNRIETGNFHKQNISLSSKDIDPGIIELNDEISWNSIYSKINNITVKTESKNWDIWLSEEKYKLNTFMWGNNTYGQLGDNTTANKSSPVLIAGEHEFITLAVGVGLETDSNAGLKIDGSAWAWGRNNYGQLGNNTTTNTSSPISVVGNHSFIKLSIGSETCAALKKDGSAWTWGRNDYGQLGNNTRTNQSSPVSVIGNHSFISIYTNAYATLALKKDGTIWAWGNGENGRLGNNSINNFSSPISVVGNKSFIFLSYGSGFSIALMEDGTAWSWGNNVYGVLGDNTATSKSSPVSVVGSHSFISVSSGRYHALALKEDGSVWAWGYNNAGQLGDNTTTNKSSPVSVVGNHSFVAISAGAQHSLATKEDGSIWAWGYNSSGELGDNTRTNKSSPILLQNNYKFVKAYGGYYGSGGLSPQIIYPIKSLKNIANAEKQNKKIIIASNYEDMTTPFSSWKYRQKITIDYTKVPNTDQENFPVLIFIENEENPIFKKSMTNGCDIYFGDINGIIEYPCEIEEYSSELGNRKLIAWVKLPIVSSSSNTEFYMYYGNHSRKRKSSPQDVWDKNYVGVWHLSDNTTSTTLDSTNNTNDMGKIAPNEPLEINGKISKAQEYDKINDRIYRNSTDSLNLATAFTLSAWVYITGTNAEEEWIIVKNTSNLENAQYGFYIQDVRTSGNIIVYVDGTSKNLGTLSLSTEVWHNLTITWDGTTINSYVNGEYLGTNSYAESLIINGTFVNIGGRSGAADGNTSAYVINGNIDETRISNIARSADWIATEYNNQNDPNSFYSIGNEEIGKKPAVYLRYDDNQGHSPAEITISGEKRSGIRTQKPVFGEEPDFSLNLTNGLSALWLFNEGSGNIVYDCSGNGHHGTIVTPDHSSWTSCKYGYCLYCDTNKRVEVPNASEVFGTSNNSLTIFVIGQLTSSTTSYRNILGAKSADGTTWGASIWFHYQTNDLRQYAMIPAASGGYIVNSNNKYSGYNDLGGPPVFLTASYSYENQLYSFYRNNLVLSWTKTLERANPQEGSPLILGADYDINATPAYGLKGYVHNICIWQRGLSSDEVTHLHKYPWCMFPEYPGYRELKLRR
jgi:alpha-tubulin suppressor-like RCC1 family protein